MTPLKKGDTVIVVTTADRFINDLNDIFRRGEGIVMNRRMILYLICQILRIEAVTMIPAAVIAIVQKEYPFAHRIYFRYAGHGRRQPAFGGLSGKEKGNLCPMAS